MNIIELTQGTPQWHTHRAQYLNASDAPAMMGCSPYKSRAELIRERATGITPTMTKPRYNVLLRGIALKNWRAPWQNASSVMTCIPVLVSMTCIRPASTA